MGKTQSGAVWLDPEKTKPYEFYQYWRNVGDSDVLKCLKMLTFLPMEEIRAMDSWEGSQLNRAKEILAYELTALVHGDEEAKTAQETAKGLFGAQGDLSNMPSTVLNDSHFTDGSISVLDLLSACKLIPSKKEGRRLIDQGGLTINEEKITSDSKTYEKNDFAGEGLLIKKGKKTFHRGLLEE